MKRYQAVSAVLAIAMFSLSGSAFQGTPEQPKQPAAPTKATAPPQSFTGVISDGQCVVKGSHKEIMKKAQVNTAANCVKGCARRYGYVLVDAAAKKVYKLNDQERLADFAAKRVKIKGALDQSTQTIYVSSIKLAN